MAEAGSSHSPECSLAIPACLFLAASWVPPSFVDVYCMNLLIGLLECLIFSSVKKDRDRDRNRGRVRSIDELIN